MFLIKNCNIVLWIWRKGNRNTKFIITSINFIQFTCCCPNLYVFAMIVNTRSFMQITFPYYCEVKKYGACTFGKR